MTAPVTAPARGPAPDRTPSFRRATIAMALGSLLGWSLPAQATLTEATYEVLFDGTQGFDPLAGPGFDQNANNGIVRTHDTFAYRVTLASNDADDNIHVRLTLPRGPGNTALAAWSYMPNNCVGADSKITDSHQTIDCHIGRIDRAGTLPIVLEARVLGTTPNQASIAAPSIAISSAKVAALQPNSTPPTLTVSAAPFYDIKIENSYQGNPKAYGFHGANGPNNEDGFYHRPMVGLIARNPNGNGRKGVEQLATDQPVQVTLDTSGYPASVRVDNWHTGPRNPASDVATLSFDDGCAGNYHGRPAASSGGVINTYDRVRDYGPRDINNDDAVPNGGDCTVRSSNRSQVVLDLHGMDTRLERQPSVTAARNPVPADESWVANKALVLWTSIDDYPDNQQILHTLRLQAFSGTSISGQPMHQPSNRNSNDEISYHLLKENNGVARKLYMPDPTVAAPLQASRDPAITGDHIVNYMAVGQQVRSTVRYLNTGTASQQDIRICDILDRTAFDLAANFGASISIQRSPRSTHQIRYGAPPAGTSMYFASTDSAPGPNEVSGQTSQTGRSAYSQARCDAPGIRWFDTPQEAERAGGLVYVQGTVNPLAGNGNAFMEINGLVLRRTWASTIQVETPVPGQRVAGQPVEIGSMIRNRAFVQTPSLPESKFAGLRDHLKVVPTRTVSRISKAVTQPANAQNAPVHANTILTYALEARYATLYPAVPDQVSVTDILPAGLHYLADSATVNGQPMEPTVQKNTPSAGLTTLIWHFPNSTPFQGEVGMAPVLARISFRARIDSKTPDNTVMRNIASITGGSNDSSPDCVFNQAKHSYENCEKSAQSEVRVLTPPGFLLEKSSTREVIEPGEMFDYWLSLLPIGQDLNAPDVPDVIDILPFVGDGLDNPARNFSARYPASSFDPGAYQLSRIMPPDNDPNIQVFYTLAKPQSIHNDPRDASNAMPGGSTRWCSEAEFGSPGCPQTIGDSTAVRFRPAIAVLKAREEYRIGMEMASHPVHAFTGNIFANRAGARTPDPNSSLLYVESQADMKVRISVHAGGIAGRVFVDGNQDGIADPADWGLKNQCVTVSGSNYRGQPVTYSTRSDDQGFYEFRPLAEQKVYNSADCSGPLLPHFNGLIRGEYRIAMPDSQSGYGDGRDHAGDTGGTVGTNQITGIKLPAGKMAQGYHFTEIARQPQLTLQSTISNTHGGQATPASPLLRASATGGSRIEGHQGEPGVTGASIPVGSYQLEGSLLPGYERGHWQCQVDGKPRAIDPATPVLTLGHGEQASCSLHYADLPARLTLLSTVTNNNGRTATPADFTLHADGPTPLNGRSGTAAVTNVTVLPGTYQLSEDELNGYVAGAWQCDAGTLTGSSLVLANGQHATCSINNTDQPVSLTLVMSVVNDHGGTASANDAPVSANGPEQISGITGSRAVTVAPVRPGVYELAEPSLPGYRTGKWVCSGGTLNGNILTLGNSMNVTCRIVLKDIPASLKVQKNVLGSVQPVSGSDSDYLVQYQMKVQHESGAAGRYALRDIPAFDPDTQILSTRISRNGQPLQLQPANDGSWLLADDQRIAIGAEDVYEMAFRIRVPYGSNNSNNRCAATGSAERKGLFNRVALRNLSADAGDTAPRHAQACIDTPVPAYKARLAIEKTAASNSAEVGDLLSYRLRIRNTGEGPAIAPVVVDRLPAGFRFEPGSLRVQGARHTQVQLSGPRELRIRLDRIEPAGQGPSGARAEVSITYRLRLGVGAQEGDGINRAHVECLSPNGASTTTCSNESRWKVRVQPGIFSEQACLAGQVFVDCNGNSLKDSEEAGIPGVRLYLQNGTWLISDAHGKYSFCGLRPRTHVLKVDTRTLPRGSRMVTSSAQNTGDALSLFIDARKGMLHRADFIEGSCSPRLIEQVKARQAQGASHAAQTEPGQPALRFESKSGPRARPHQQGTDPASQPVRSTRH